MKLDSLSYKNNLERILPQNYICDKTGVIFFLTSKKHQPIIESNKCRGV